MVERPVRVERRLSAIMAADIAGYSRLMHDDEEATHGRLTALFAEVIEPTVAEHRGHIVKNTGDGFLAEFPSAVQAVRAAARFQSAVGDLQKNDAKGRRLLFRVGINIGDVIVEPHDIFGDGVNIAARLEGIAEPGGICISSSAFDQVRGKVDTAFEDMGPQALKNIVEPIRVWRAKPLGSEVPKEEPERPVSAGPGGLQGPIRGRLKLAGGALASVAAVGLVGYWNVWNTVRTDVLPDGQKTQREAAARPDIAPRLSLVVLPFANLNSNPEQDYFADGITTDLTTDLAQMPGAFVIGRGTAFTYKNKQIDFRTLGKDLGIRWAVQGAVRRNADQVRVNVSLTDIASGRDVWSDRFDGDRTNLAALQDQITARLARSLNIELIQAESRRSEVDRSRNPDATDFMMRGLAKLYEPQSKIQNSQAKDLFDSALRLDPNNVEAMVGKARCLSVGANNRWSASVVEDKKQAIDLIDRVLSKRPASASAHTTKANILLFGHPEEALAEYNAALEIDPNDPTAYAGKAITLVNSGRAREAFSAAQLALRVSPKDPFASLWRFWLCHAHLHLHQYGEAIEECRRSVNLNRLNWYAYVDLTSAFGATGQLEQAEQSLTELNKLRPDFTIQWYRDLGYSISSNPQFRREFDDILDGLRKGGVREQ
jgi:class 3 adenylate cyclase/TolB-like protein